MILSNALSTYMPSLHISQVVEVLTIEFVAVTTVLMFLLTALVLMDRIEKRLDVG